MSAINDALRRASGAAAGAVEPPALPIGESVGALPPPLPAMSLPGDSSLPPLLQPPATKKSFPWILVVVVFLFCIGGAAGLYLWKGSGRIPFLSRKSGETVVKQVSETTRPIPAVPAPEKPKSPEPVPSPSASTGPVKVVAATPAPVAPPVTPRPPAQFPQLRLQGIYYRPSNPSVMINNHTLYVNDQVQGVTVAAIDASSVTLVLSGQTNILTLR